MNPVEWLSEGYRMFQAGGLIMYMLGAVAFLLYGTAFAALVYVGRGNLNEKQADHWIDFINDPSRADGRMGKALSYVLHGDNLTIKTVSRRFDEIRINMISSIDRRLVVLNTLIAAAPLCGLLGTVTGMLGMFAGLAHGKGAAGMQRVAAGMQEALITTQTGLTIALPGLFIALIIKSKRDNIAACLVRLESLILTTRFPRESKS